MFYLKIILFFCLLVEILACTSKKSDDVSNVQEPVLEQILSTDVALSDISRDGCLNLELLSQLINEEKFSKAPAMLMTTDFKPIDEITNTKLTYFSHANFYFKQSQISDLWFFTNVRQTDCKTVQLLSSSEEILSFDVVSSSEAEILIKLKDKFRETMTDTQKKSLLLRQQPYEYKITYISPHEIALSEKFNTVDPICVSKTSLKFEISKRLRWANRFDEIPSNFDLDLLFFNQVKDSIPPETFTQLTLSDPVSLLSVQSIQTIMQMKIRPELLLCVP